jgi:DNA-binding XRE family transcriptional regulator
MTEVQRGTKIRRMRETAYLNQAAVASAVGMTRQEYASVETGKIDASTAVYEQMEAAILNLARKRAEAVAEMQAVRA